MISEINRLKRVIAFLVFALVAVVTLSGVSIADAIGENPLENYVPVVKFNEGLYTALPIQTTSTLTTASGLTADSAVITNAASVGSTFSAGGLATLNGGQLRSSTNATSTDQTSLTLVQADILNYDTLLITPNTGALTYTLPATSTLTSFVPTAGDMVEQCWYNATTTSAATVTVTAGTGMDLERVATSTTSGSVAVLAIPSQGSACFKFVRQTDTDISVLMTSFINSD